MNRRLWTLLVSLLLMLSTPLLYADERILEFHSEIDVQQDGSLLVNETIRVRAEGGQIKRGIYRDFPTTYRDALGNTTTVGFEPISVTRDGADEPWHMRNHANGKRVYIGSENVFLQPGEYRYRIQYRTTRQLGFFEAYDELYWNVTGNGWNFPIDRASAQVQLPQAIAAENIGLNGYTGLSGSKEQAVETRIVDGGRFHFAATRKLEPNEGLTIVLTWPKGIVTEPSAEQLREAYIDDNRHNLIALGGLGLVLAYYLLIWLRVGKDPERGVIMPRYQAPDGFSPASMRFIQRMKYDNGCFTAALVNLTVKGAIEIEQDANKRFVIKRGTEPQVELAAGEAEILGKLLGNDNEITLKQSEHRTIRGAIRAHEASLRTDYEKLYFLTNKRYFMPGILLSIGAIIFAATQIPGEDMSFATMFVGMFTLIPFFILAMSFKRIVRQPRASSFINIAVQLGFFGIFFLVAGEAVGQMLAQLDNVAWPILISAYLMLASNVLFEQWLKAPTLAGRKLLDEVEGFQQYLDVAEEEELRLSGQPTFTTDLYERFLPFAIALGVDHAWSARLDRAVTAGTVTGDYHPRGFRHYRNEGFTDFSHSLSNSLESAISASSTAPGSSSGSSGGSSGGGGGGGGGGGW